MPRGSLQFNYANLNSSGDWFLKSHCCCCISLMPLPICPKWKRQNCCLSGHHGNCLIRAIVAWIMPSEGQIGVLPRRMEFQCDSSSGRCGLDFVRFLDKGYPFKRGEERLITLFSVQLPSLKCLPLAWMWQSARMGQTPLLRLLLCWQFPPWNETKQRTHCHQNVPCWSVSRLQHAILPLI